MVDKNLLYEWDEIINDVGAPYWKHYGVAKKLIPQLLNRIQELEESLKAWESDDPPPTEPIMVINSKENVLTIYTDGGANDNLGNGGWGYVISLGDERKPDAYVVRSEHNRQIIPDTTNNRMELKAAIEAITHVLDNHMSATKIIIRADSQYVVNGITEWIIKWREKDFRGVLNDDLWRILDVLNSSLRARFRVEWQWIPKDSHPLNKMAHNLSNKVR